MGWQKVTTVGAQTLLEMRCPEVSRRGDVQTLTTINRSSDHEPLISLSIPFHFYGDRLSFEKDAGDRGERARAGSAR
jgi:hypothetical protein